MSCIIEQEEFFIRDHLRKPFNLFHFFILRFIIFIFREREKESVQGRQGA